MTNTTITKRENEVFNAIINGADLTRADKEVLRRAEGKGLVDRSTMEFSAAVKAALGLATEKKATGRNMASAVSESWKNPCHRTARSKRYAIEADGIEYSSLPKALEALGIEENPAFIKKMRSTLVENGSGTLYGINFKVIY